MRVIYLALGFVLFFSIYEISFALPFLGTIPLIFELGILLYAFMGIIISSFIFVILQYKKTLFIGLILLNIIFILILNFLFSEGQLAMARVAFTHVNITVIHLYYMFFVSVLISGGVYFFFREKKRPVFSLIYIFTTCFFLILGIIQISLIHATLDLGKKMDRVLGYYKNAVPSDLHMSSKQIRNSIFISQDFDYMDGDKKRFCRITVSYYLYNGKPYQKIGDKGNKIQVMTGLDHKHCYNVIRPLLDALNQ